MTSAPLPPIVPFEPHDADRWSNPYLEKRCVINLNDKGDVATAIAASQDCLVVYYAFRGRLSVFRMDAAAGELVLAETSVCPDLAAHALFGAAAMCTHLDDTVMVALAEKHVAAQVTISGLAPTGRAVRVFNAQAVVSAGVRLAVLGTRDPAPAAWPDVIQLFDGVTFAALQTVELEHGLHPTTLRFRKRDTLIVCDRTGGCTAFVIGDDGVSNQSVMHTGVALDDIERVNGQWLLAHTLRCREVVAEVRVTFIDADAEGGVKLVRSYCFPGSMARAMLAYSPGIGVCVLGASGGLVVAQLVEVTERATPALVRWMLAESERFIGITQVAKDGGDVAVAESALNRAQSYWFYARCAMSALEMHN